MKTVKEIAIYGGGGLGREIACLLQEINNRDAYINEEWKLIGFFDDGLEKGSDVAHFGPVLGGMKELNEWPSELNIALCFGSPRTLAKVSSLITNPNIRFPNIIYPNFFVADPATFKIGKGNIITGGCCVTTNVTMGDFNLLNGSDVFGHDVRVGNCNVFMPGVRISGEVTIGNECLFGAQSFVKQQLTVPDRVTLSPLSPLLTKPKADSLYMGNPAKLVKF